MKFLISVCLFVNIINQSYSQQRLNLNCAYLETGEYQQGYQEGKSWGAAVRQETMLNFGIGPGTFLGFSFSTTHEQHIHGENPFEPGSLGGGYGGTSLEMALNSYQYWRADAAAESIRQGPYCTLYNSAREDGFWAGYLGI